MKRATILLFFIGINISVLHAQTEDIQWLQVALKNSPENTQKVDLLVHLSDKLLDIDADQAQDYAEDAVKLAKKLHYAAGEGKAQILIGKAHLKQDHPRRAVNNLEKAITWAEHSRDTSLLIDFYQTLARAYVQDKDTKEAELYKQKYLNLQQFQANLENQARIKTLQKQFSAQKDSASLARLEAVNAQETADSVIDIVNQKETALLQQNLELANLEKKAAQFEQEKLQSELQLEREQQRLAKQKQRFYWVIAGSALLLLLGLGAWFYFQSRQAKKLAKMERSEAERLRLLTAGIAHEIKNPLNFVTNFADGSNEISDELEELLSNNQQNLRSDQFQLLQELVGDLKQNSIDIKKNGQRVDSIVRSMMEYASGSKGTRQQIKLNELVDENINLAYHGYRARHSDFNMKIEKKYDETLSPIEVIPQDMGRVLLNILNNACYALHEKQKKAGNNYSPTLTVSTESQNGEAIVRIRDNGPGIPEEVRDKIFTPFFTTKPTGLGNTGLGLSMSYEIVVQEHQGKLSVDSQPGKFTEFTIVLPKNTQEI